jgi:4-amino-4-deoxy-L-arabinose transferase-like glycosyltransferase
MPFRSPKIRKPEGIAPSPVISAPAVAWNPENQGKNEPPLLDKRLFRLLLVWTTLIVVFYIGSCGYPRLLDQIDGQYAGAAREMISRNDWVVPTQNSVPRLRKPPLAYWMEILSFRTFGESEFAARLPICLATFAWFITTAGLAYECTRDRLVSLVSSIILATFFGTFQFSHLIMPEPAFGFLITLSFWLLLRLARKTPGVPGDGSFSIRRIRHLLTHWNGDTHQRPITNHPAPVTLELLLLWAAMALGVLCKGSHGLLLPLGVLLVAAIVRPGLRPLCRRVILNPTGWLLFIVLVLPWYLAVEHRYPGFILDQFGNEQVNMVFGRRWPVDGDHLPLLNFWLEQFGVLFPWTLLIPGAAVTSFRVLKFNPRVSPNALILLLWFFSYSVAITFANIQDYYLLICLPVIAIWLAWSLRQ